MKKEELRKIKWRIDTKYFFNEKQMSYEELEKLNYEIKSIVKHVAVYEEGYFHKWIEEYFGDLHEGINTHEYALIEKKSGEIIYKKPDEIIFIDEFEDKVFNNLRQLVGQSLKNDKFTDAIEFIRILSTNELIQTHIKDITQGFENGVLEQILGITEELFNTKGNEERLKVVINKYEL